MKGRTVIIVAAIAVILGAIVLIVEKPFSSDSGEEAAPDSLQAVESVPVFDKVSEENCFRIEISSMDGRTTASLARKGDMWYTDPERGYPADETKIDRIFEALADVEQGEVASVNPDNHPRFEVDKLTGKHVTFYDKNSNVLEDVIIGKMGSNYMSRTTYVRKAGSDRVLSVKAFLMNSFRPGQENWRKRAIFDYQPDEITAFTIEQPGEPEIELAKFSSGEWTCVSPPDIQLKDDVGRNISNAFSRLRASDFVDDYPLKSDKEYGLDQDAVKITASLKDYSSTPTLFIGKENPEKKGRWFVRAKDQHTVYLVSKYTHDRLVRTPEDLEPTPTPVPTPKLEDDVREQMEKRKEEVENMSEQERKEAVQKKINELMKQNNPNP